MLYISQGTDVFFFWFILVGWCGGFLHAMVTYYGREYFLKKVDTTLSPWQYGYRMTYIMVVRFILYVCYFMLILRLPVANRILVLMGFLGGFLCAVMRGKINLYGKS
jgi:hypothetical protein